MDSVDIIAKQAQEYYSHRPTIIIGSGASAALGLSGMGALATHLIENVKIDALPEKDGESWGEFCKLLHDGTDLETALHQVPLSDELTNRVVEQTWQLINPEDIGVYKDSLATPAFFALGQLFSAMFNSTHSAIEVITTNYDRLVEYACEQEGYHHYTGFSHGYTRRLVDRSHLTAQRSVNIWKVHGSLDWFKNGADETVGLGQVSYIPDDYQAQIITPGIDKYRLTHLDPFRQVISHSDAAIHKANSYLCVGFGFNDQHIQEKLVHKCIREKSMITIITWGLTEAAKKFLESGVPNYIAIERGETDMQSIIHSSQLGTPVTVDGDFWSLAGYLSLIL